MSGGDVYVAGTRSFAGEIADYAADAGFRVVGLLEPQEREKVGSEAHGLTVEWLEEAPPGVRSAIVGTGDTRRRELVARLQAAGFTVVSLVHPHAHVSRTSTICPGALVGPGVVVGAYASVGEHAVLGRGSLVGHHTDLGPYATLGPGANVAGNVRIGPEAFVAMGAVVRDHVTVGEGAVVAMGAVVVGDVPAHTEVLGLPASPRPPGQAGEGEPEKRRAR